MSKLRNARGQALAEFGPALGILLIGFLFPMLNLLGLFCSYGSCMLLNYAQCEEAALLSQTKAKDQSGLIAKRIPDHWLKNGLGKFAGLTSNPSTAVTHQGPKQNCQVTVTTTFNCHPWFPVPLPVHIAGMNAPFKFVIEGRRPVESATDRS